MTLQKHTCLFNMWTYGATFRAGAHHELACKLLLKSHAVGILENSLSTRFNDVLRFSLSRYCGSVGEKREFQSLPAMLCIF